MVPKAPLAFALVLYAQNQSKVPPRDHRFMHGPLADHCLLGRVGLSHTEFSLDFSCLLVLLVDHLMTFSLHDFSPLNEMVDQGDKHC